MNISDCHNVNDFRALAKKRLPFPIFDYIDGAADDEVTRRRNTAAYERCDLVPNVLTGVENIDMSTTVMGQKLTMPLFLSPTALQRLFHWQGERAVARAAEKFGTYFGISSLGTVSIEEIGESISTPKMFQPVNDRPVQGSQIRCADADRRYDSRRQSRTLPPIRLHQSATDHPDQLLELCRQTRLGAELHVP
jgi:isopentenyl diphosphate isomerase/L-lactate dehydrogenase-like FMN-dependent dehydrogenase